MMAIGVNDQHGEEDTHTKKVRTNILVFDMYANMQLSLIFLCFATLNFISQGSFCDLSRPKEVYIFCDRSLTDKA